MAWEGDSTQLYYARNRWYDPAIRRFESEDPIGLAGGINDYAFAGNEPIDGSDWQGLDYGCPTHFRPMTYTDGNGESHFIKCENPGGEDGGTTPEPTFPSPGVIFPPLPPSLGPGDISSISTGSGSVSAPGPMPVPDNYYKNQCIRNAVIDNALSLGLDAVGLIPEAGGIARFVGHEAGYRGVVADRFGASIIGVFGKAAGSGHAAFNITDTSALGIASTGLAAIGLFTPLAQFAAAASLAVDVTKTVQAIRACRN